MSSTKAPVDPLREWYVLRRGEQQGPYTRAALLDVLAVHPQGLAACVWRQGMLDWRPAARVSALSPNGEREAADAGVPEVTSTVTRIEPPRVISAQDSALITHEPPAHESAAANAHAEARASTEPPAAPETAPLLIARPVAQTRRAPLEAETTHDMPVYRPAPPPADNRIRYALTGAGFVTFTALLYSLSLRATSRPRLDPAATAEASAAVVAEAPAAVAGEAPPARPLPAPAPASAPVAPAPTMDVAPPAAEPPVLTPAATAVKENHAEHRHGLMRVRVRARWAPIRAEADPAARVLCSAQRGAELTALAERPGTHARWFSVRCDVHRLGWVHENFLFRVKP